MEYIIDPKCTGENMCVYSLYIFCVRKTSENQSTDAGRVLERIKTLLHVI